MHLRVSVVLVAFLLSLAVPPAATVSIAGASPPAGPPYVEGELIVKYKDEQLALAGHRAVKAEFGRAMRPMRLHQVRLPVGMPVREGIAAYQRDPNVEFVEPNYIVTKALAPNDPRYPEQWSLPKVSAEGAWDQTTGGSVVVAVLDTGIDYDHEDLKANIWTNTAETPGNGIDDDGNGIIDDVYGVNYNDGVNTGDPMDDDTADAHGTHVAGVIGAVGNNAVGVSGLAWTVSLMAVKFLHGDTGTGTVADAVLGVHYAVDMGARVVNNSYSLSGYSMALADAFDYADANGVLVVSVAGNDGTDTDVDNVSPGSIRTPNNLTAAATTSSDALASYSNFGRTTVDVGAPGTSILAPDLTDAYSVKSGTSLAAPHVSGLAALVFALYPAETHHGVKARILNGVDAIAGLSAKTIAGGRINADSTLSNPEYPSVFKVTPKSVSPGAAVTVTGVNFGATPGTVKINDLAMTVGSWTDGEIEATVPALAIPGDVQVNASGSTFYLNVVTQPPVVTLAASSISGLSPLDVTFTATASDPDGSISSYEWDFGGGTFKSYVGMDDTATRQFASPGTYTVRVRVTDNSGLTATASALVTVLSASGPSSSGAGCFIATAAYGSYLAPEVMVLREFRDEHLLTNPAGRALIAAYYRTSPPVAGLIARHEALRYVTRWGLTPVVYGVKYPWGALAVVVAGLVVAGRGLKRRKRRG